MEFFYGKKIRVNAVVLHCLVVDKFDFTRKIVKLFLWKNICENIFYVFDFTRKIGNFFLCEKIRENAFL